MEIEPSKDCAFDALTFYDGPTKNSSILSGPLCTTYRRLSRYKTDHLVCLFNFVLWLFVLERPHTTRL